MTGNSNVGNEIYSWIEDLFPICRSISGEGLRETVSYFKNLLPNISINSVKSGTKVFDWVVPDEWNIKEAFIENADGVRIVDFKNNNLHVVGYSESEAKKLFKKIDVYKSKFRPLKYSLSNLKENVFI